MGDHPLEVLWGNRWSVAVGSWWGGRAETLLHLLPWRRAWVLQEGGWEQVCLGCHHVPRAVPSLPVVGAPSLWSKQVQEAGTWGEATCTQDLSLQRKSRLWELLRAKAQEWVEVGSEHRVPSWKKGEAHYTPWQSETEEVLELGQQ